MEGHDDPLFLLRGGPLSRRRQHPRPGPRIPLRFRCLPGEWRRPLARPMALYCLALATLFGWSYRHEVGRDVVSADCRVWPNVVEQTNSLEGVLSRY